MILRQKATRCASLAHPDGEIYQIDACYASLLQLARCCSHEGRGCSKLLCECRFFRTTYPEGCKPVFRTQWAQFRDATSAVVK